jgi:hypothetical protein
LVKTRKDSSQTLDFDEVRMPRLLAVISALPEDALNEINRIQTRERLNAVVKTGVPGFIAQGR